MCRFSVDAKGNELMQATAASAASHDGDGVVDGFDELFWHTQLRRLTNLVSLSLNLIATDDILVLVGESCPKLEIVNIISRIKQVFFLKKTPAILSSCFDSFVCIFLGGPPALQQHASRVAQVLRN